MLEYLVSGAIQAALLTVVWYLLRQKDRRNEEDIKRLFELHEVDERSLTELRITIAAEHYPKRELDPKFDRLEQAITQGLNKLNIDLGGKFDKLSQALIEHITIENGRKSQ